MYKTYQTALLNFARQNHDFIGEEDLPPLTSADINIAGLSAEDALRAVVTERQVKNANLSQKLKEIISSPDASKVRSSAYFKNMIWVMIFIRRTRNP